MTEIYGGPVDRIGVAMSGGGYRAGAWGMGALLYLADAGLQARVSTISSVSGGSITNGSVALARFHDAKPADVWALTARLAKGFTGNVTGFLFASVLHLACWTTMIVGASLHNGPLFVIAAAAVVGVSVAGSGLAADATFGRPLVWLYLDVAMAAASLLGYAIGAGWWWLAALVLLGAVLMFRGTVVGWALGASLFRVDGKRAHLSDLDTDIEHVMCACDLHGRHHVYFGRDFVYSFGLGLGRRPSLPLSAAVQSSANLPGAFAPRAMRRGPFKFVGGRYTAPVLALTDGGVYDNMADEWLLSYGQRAASFTKRATRLTDPADKAVATATAERLTERTPQLLVIANASGAIGFKFTWTTFIPALGEIFALLRVKSILYDNGNTTRRRLIVDDFIRGHRKGFLVHIGTDPWTVVADGKKSLDPLTQGRAEAVAAVLRATPGLDPETTKTPANAGTVLYPLSRGRIGNLIQRAYALSMAQGHVWHNLPLVDIPPLADFVTLESGRVSNTVSP